MADNVPAAKQSPKRPAAQPEGEASPNASGKKPPRNPRKVPPSYYEEFQPPPRQVKTKGTTFLRDNHDTEYILPRPLPKGITYVANFTTYNDLMDREILQVDEDEKVHLSTDEVLAIYRAKCEDQNLQVSWQRESRFMELISKNCKGLTFSLRENGLGYLSAHCIAEVLARNNYYALLDLSGNRLRDQGAECIAQLLEHNDTLVHLALKSNDIGHIGGEAIARALETNQTLTSLDMSGISGINRNHLGTKGASALSSALQVNNVLCILNLGSNGLGKEGMGLLAQGLTYNTTITDIDLSSNNLGWEGCQILGQVIDCANFKNLNLERNYIGDRGCTIIAHALKNQKIGATLMESINLSFNGIRSTGFKYFAEAIRLTKGLKTARFDGNECGDDGAYDFAMALRENKSLLHLSLNKTELSAEGGVHFGEALQHNTTLQKLELGDNNAGDSGVAAVCAGLRKEKCSIQYLDVSNNKIGEKGGLELAMMIKSNSVLQHLLIKQNNIKVSAERISEALKSNKSLLSLDFTFNDFSYKSFSSIEQSLGRNMKIYKSTAGERLMGQIQVLKRDEELLFLTRDNIEEEIKQREIAKEKVKQKRESLKKMVGVLKADLHVLEEELATKQAERSTEEELNYKLSEETAKFKSKMDKQTQSLQKKIEAEQEKMQKFQKQMQTTQKTMQKLVDTEEEFFAPILEQLRIEEQNRETARQDAKWEAEKLVQWELKLKNLEKTMDQETGGAAAKPAAAPAPEGKKAKGKKK